MLRSVDLSQIPTGEPGKSLEHLLMERFKALQQAENLKPSNTPDALGKWINDVFRKKIYIYLYTRYLTLYIEYRKYLTIWKMHKTRNSRLKVVDFQRCNIITSNSINYENSYFKKVEHLSILSSKINYN